VHAGHTFEREAIERWLRNHNTSPLTGSVLPNREVHPAPVAFRNAIREWEKAYSKLISRASITPERFDRSTMIGVGSFKEVCFLCAPSQHATHPSFANSRVDCACALARDPRTDCMRRIMCDAHTQTESV
jgi:hypothetical protein